MLVGVGRKETVSDWPGPLHQLLKLVALAIVVFGAPAGLKIGLRLALKLLNTSDAVLSPSGVAKSGVLAEKSRGWSR